MKNVKLNLACWGHDGLSIKDLSILPSCLVIWLAWYFLFYSDDDHTWKYITKITSTLSSHAFEYKWRTNHLYIRTVTSALHINAWYLISHCWTTMMMDSELCSYRHITRQLQKRYNINKTMMVSSWYGITNLLYQFFKCWTIRQNEHSLYRASLIHPLVGLILAFHPHWSIPTMD